MNTLRDVTTFEDGIEINIDDIANKLIAVDSKMAFDGDIIVSFAKN